ncbi:anti-sigma factor [Aestuariibaculum sediminum]|uniref:Anti-sigma factor n=1 Tax=Aestuariibaculum sediminum TaxID=2770637 RepID=A0A8J6Q2E8_9FLAO|nr:anti-sigma factor [Aestuariibaculum sediminum]MBD0832039.1 anti-sigma factor [Aestuariibaculum sediminum]
MMKKTFILLLVLTSFVFSCSDDDDNTSNTLTLNLQGLEALGDDFVYEGWIIVNGAPISTGVFSSVTFPQEFTVSAKDLQLATTFVLSIEPKNDTDPAPSNTKILAGDFALNQAIINSKAVVGDFSESSGKYILATPTNGNNTNEFSGVWFLDLSSGSPATGLDLPELNSGWKYEGWVVMNGQPISTGTFSSVSGFDDNATTSTFKGSINDGPPFPGEDYIQNAPTGLTFPTDLRGAVTVISVEPYPDNSSAPFAFKPLMANIPTNAADHATLSLTVGPLSELTGTVSR